MKTINSLIVLMFCLLINFSVFGQENFATKISGRFIMKGADCAGFNFISPTHIVWTSELFCDSGADTLKIQWIDNVTFFTRDIVRRNEICAPRVMIYQVVSFDGENLILKDFWTGWNDFKNEKITLKRGEPVR